MRAGSNPQKKSKKITLSVRHKVVVVVFIPEMTGYYAEAMEIFKLCLDSLLRTNTGAYRITVVNNGSCQELRNLLATYSSSEVDTVIHHSENIGKIDALIGAARGCREDFITLTDSDILFLKDWDIATMNVFRKFKKAGSVSPIPFRHGLFYGTSSVLKDILLKRIEYRKLEIPENFIAHNQYLSSINWNQEKDDTIKWPLVESNGLKAIVGSGHQVLTLRREILFKNVPYEPSLTLVGGNSENKYVDEPIDKSGLYRLSTYHTFAFHLGNRVEDWMKDIKQLELNGEKKISGQIPFLTHKKKSVLHRGYVLRKQLAKRLFKIFQQV